MNTRETVFAGSFYPNNLEELTPYFKEQTNEINFENIRGIISPHAGYLYSGETANLAYSNIKQKYDRIVVVGPSHRVGFDGASIALYDTYQTPLGDLEIDVEFSKNLERNHEFLFFNDAAHKEHSTETQMPFIKYYFPKTKVVEIVYGRIDCDELSIMLDEVLANDNNLVVISTDLSHFHSLELANKIDEKSLNAIEALEPNVFIEDCEACGGIGVKAFLSSSKKIGLKSYVLDYRTSYEANKDKNQVVGYVSAIVST